VESRDRYSNMETADIDDAKKVESLLSNSPFDQHIIVDIPPVGPRALPTADTLLVRFGNLFRTLAARAKGEGRIATVTLLSTQMPTAAPQEPAESTLTPTQKAFIKAEKEWVAFGEANSVRVVIMRVADRVYGPKDSAVQHIAAGTRSNPCRITECTDDEPLTRIHSDDLTQVLRRILSMFDIVDTHGADSSMKGTASMDASIARLPTGTILEVVDSGPADSMKTAERVASVMMTGEALCHTCADTTFFDKNGDGFFSPAELKDTTCTPKAAGHELDTKRNTRLKDVLGVPQLIYETYRQGGASLFGKGEF